jgi:hypothetical protein
MCLLGC